ncbi:MAG TPA: hypothetical protein VNL69_03205 [Bacteroidota bacterium]|nr:hypothetical protein [Bacteroidota bacterium]
MAELDPEQIIRQIINRAFLLRIGQETLAIIHARTLRGEFLEGSTTRGYSVKPAPMPLSGLIARLGKSRGQAIWRRIQKGDEPGTVWRESKSGKIWITLQGGYKRLRELSGRESDRVTLNWTGRMLQALKEIQVNEQDMSVTISFTNTEAATIAGYHHAGAGRTKIKRLFVGLTEEELSKLVGLASRP